MNIASARYFLRFSATGRGKDEVQMWHMSPTESPCPPFFPSLGDKRNSKCHILTFSTLFLNMMQMKIDLKSICCCFSTLTSLHSIGCIGMQKWNEKKSCTFLLKTILLRNFEQHMDVKGRFLFQRLMQQGQKSLTFSFGTSFKQVIPNPFRVVAWRMTRGRGFEWWPEARTWSFRALNEVKVEITAAQLLIWKARTRPIPSTWPWCVSQRISSFLSLLFLSCCLPLSLSLNLTKGGCQNLMMDLLTGLPLDWLSKNKAPVVTIEFGKSDHQKVGLFLFRFRKWLLLCSDTLHRSSLFFCFFFFATLAKSELTPTPLFHFHTDKPECSMGHQRPQIVGILPGKEFQVQARIIIIIVSGIGWLFRPLISPEVHHVADFCVNLFCISRFFAPCPRCRWQWPLSGALLPTCLRLWTAVLSRSESLLTVPRWKDSTPPQLSCPTWSGLSRTWVSLSARLKTIWVRVFDPVSSSSFQQVSIRRRLIFLIEL